MKHVVKPHLWVFALIFALTAMAGRADIPVDPRPMPPPVVNPPNPQTSNQKRFVARLADGDAPTVIKIPRSVLQAAPAPRADAAGSPAPTAPTVVAGLALAAAMVAGGLQLSRGRRMNGGVLMLGALIGVGLMVRAAHANAPFQAGVQGGELKMPEGARGPANVYILGQGDDVDITLSRDMAAWLTVEAMQKK